LGLRSDPPYPRCTHTILRRVPRSQGSTSSGSGPGSPEPGSHTGLHRFLGPGRADLVALPAAPSGDCKPTPDPPRTVPGLTESNLNPPPPRPEPTPFDHPLAWTRNPISLANPRATPPRRATTFPFFPRRRCGPAPGRPQPLDRTGVQFHPTSRLVPPLSSVTVTTGHGPM